MNQINKKALNNLRAYPLTSTFQSINRGLHHLYYVKRNPNNKSFVKGTNKPTLKYDVTSKGTEF